MRNRTLAIVITVLAVFLCACPGLAFLCFGFSGFLDYYALQSYIFGITDKTTMDVWGITGMCLGVVFILIAVLVVVLALRKPKDYTPTSNEPLPPTM